MEGRSVLGRAAIVLIAAGGLCLPHNSFGQAMGKVTLDGGGAPTVATAPAEAIIVPGQPASMAPVQPAGVAPGATVVPAVAKTIAPISVPAAPESPAMPATAPAAVESKLPVKPETVVEKNSGDSMPADPAKAVVPLRAIEHQEIHPRTQIPENGPAEAAGGGGGGGTGGAKSSIPPGITSVLQVAAALGVVIGLILIGKAAAKKFLPSAKAGNGKGVIEILARYPLAKNQSLVLVRIGSQIVTLNQGKDQSQSVLVINDANEVARIMGQIEGTNPKSIQAGFNKLLANARMDLEEPVGRAGGEREEDDFESRSMEPENLDTQLEEMASAKRQLMELRQQVRSVRDSLPR